MAGRNHNRVRSVSRCLRSRRAHARPLPAHAQSPAFRVDPYWPKPLPNNWILGQVGGISVDAQDNIWVFQRPRSLTDDEKGATLDPPRSKCCVPAPSVLVFNQAGDVVKSWGGPGDNLGYDWPLQEHGILVDNKGFVWLQRQRQGRQYGVEVHHRRQIRQANRQERPADRSTDLSQFGQVAALEFDKDANEIYAADGYGNHRVAVLDGDTGEIKRVWGAYGKPPTRRQPAGLQSRTHRNSPTRCIASRSARTASSMSATAPTTACRSSARTAASCGSSCSIRSTRGPGSAWGLAFSPLDKKQNYFVLIDGTNNVIETVRRKDGAVVGSFGRPGRNAGEFHWVHVAKFDSRGNLYTGEVDTGKRLQKWVPVE